MPLPNSSPSAWIAMSSRSIYQSSRVTDPEAEQRSGHYQRPCLSLLTVLATMNGGTLSANRYPLGRSVTTTSP